jgi:DNA-binding beta-propeller fold protein YncE
MVMVIDGSTPGALSFNRPEGLALDGAQRLYVADSCNHRIQIYDEAGRFLRAHGRAGEREGEFSYPYDIRVDGLGRQFICEFGNSRIQVLDDQDRLLEILGGAGSAVGQLNNPWAIALDSQGNLYVADSLNHRVQKWVARRGTKPGT